MAPRLGPVVGLSLAAVSGSLRFFLRMLVALALGVLLVGVAAGLAYGFALEPETTSLLPYEHIKLNLVDFALLLTGAVVMAIVLARSERVAGVASVAVAYELFLPLGAAAVGFILAEPELIEGAALTFVLHLTWAIAAGALHHDHHGIPAAYWEWPVAGGSHRHDGAAGRGQCAGIRHLRIGCHPDSHTNPHPHTNRYPYPYPDGHCHTNCDTDQHGHCHRYKHRDKHADPDASQGDCVRH